ncbi:MAG TPA: hypothetical protein PKI61_02065 [bacterium]|mgnify:CR=1 FL=1|nr:hypothetical protein [bacterium]HPT29650.1 hypothetical protein [bacterium]
MPVSSKKTAKTPVSRVRASKSTAELPSVVRPGDEFDSRRQFFQMISRQINNPEAPAEEINIKTRSFGMYRRMARRFLILTVILVLVVLYFTLVRMTIVVHPSREVVSDSVVVDVYTLGTLPAETEKAVAGQILPVVVEGQAEFPATGEKPETAAVAGQVTVYNNYTQSQTLVATTRLLSADNKLFRLKKNVIVAANSQAKVEVYADKPGEDMAIAPTRFTIPGLRANLQSLIYAESQEAFSYDTKVQKYISQADVDKASQEINKALVEQVEKNNGPAENYDQAAYDSNLSSLKVELVDAKLGEQRDTFILKGKNTVNVISFNRQDIVAIVQAQLKKNLSPEKTINQIDETGFKYSFSGYNSQDGIASVKVDYSSQLTSAKSNIIDRRKLVNLSQGQVENYLRGVKEIDGFELYFNPGFIKRSPCLVDRIKVEVK